MFRLKKLHIDLYKNLSSDYDFSINNGYIALIGLNGSGKSNLLEAISIIFNRVMDIPDSANISNYDISYNINESDIALHYEDKSSLEEQPSMLISCYSGEDSRLWEKCYLKYYVEFFSAATKNNGKYKPKSIYINKFCWKIAFISLLFSEKLEIQDFLQKKLNIDVNSVRVKFFERPGNIIEHDSSRWYLRVKETLGTDYFSIEDLKNIELQNTQYIEELTDDALVFYYLYLLSMPEKNPKIDMTVDKIIEKIDISVNGYNFDDLSEGEKKLILIECITKVLGDENSLVLLDEPDAHTHIAMKKDLLELISEFKGQTIMTTHSPMFLNKRWDGYKEENIFYMHDGKIENTKPLEHLAELTDNEIDYFDSAYILGAKNLLIVEGPNDKRYLEKAISIFSKKDEKYNKLSNVTILPGNSAGNAKALYDLVLKQKIDKMENLVYLFDYDGGGYDGNKAIKKIENPKVKSIFYQHDYSQVIDLSNKPQDKDTIMVEDFFSTDAYSVIIAQEEIEKKQSHKDFRNFKTNMASSIKTHIENHYNSSSFKEEWYDGFKPILDKLLGVFNLN